MVVLIFCLRVATYLSIIRFIFIVQRCIGDWQFASKIEHFRKPLEINNFSFEIGILLQSILIRHSKVQRT